MWTTNNQVSLHINIWAATWQNQQCGCAPSKDSDQPGHPPSLIRVFAVRMKKPRVLSYPLSAQRRHWSDWADAQADLSLHWAQTLFVGFVMRWLIFWLVFPVCRRHVGSLDFHIASNEDWSYALMHMLIWVFCWSRRFVDFAVPQLKWNKTDFGGPHDWVVKAANLKCSKLLVISPLWVQDMSQAKFCLRVVRWFFVGISCFRST